MLVPYSLSTLSSTLPVIAADATVALLLLAALGHCCTMERPVILEIWTPRSNSIKLSIQNHPYSEDGPSRSFQCTSLVWYCHRCFGCGWSSFFLLSACSCRFRMSSVATGSCCMGWRHHFRARSCENIRPGPYPVNTSVTASFQ